MTANDMPVGPDGVLREPSALEREFAAAKARRDIPAMQACVDRLRAEVDELAGEVAAGRLAELLADLGQGGA